MSTLEFRKSSYSNGDHECVEVATNHPDTVAIRDSKHPEGPILRVAPAAWTAFREAVVQTSSRINRR
ncbi:hypothetical protein SBI_03701 [Streptomyces bingchenggensis BCW-1]|uniref:DUF397 domain-containing protein n=1 Tax=Streptomyces bingchenggensis (strain BCW-1) TaxID=749414 RepID=D7CFR4_STRBB|nr:MULTISPECIES: DUF397 domain-containing protein [Streptomyces]ADI06822.1 hypothetical protein SBI_03701 [Streptomyces bingchenggensis BCW-1]